MLTIAALIHFYAAWWFDVGRQHDMAKHYAVLKGVVNFEAFASYNAPYYYVFTAFISAPFAALYRMHFINDATFMWLSVVWSGFILLLAYAFGCFVLARTFRFTLTEQFFFVSLCIFLPPIQRSFAMLRPENLILALIPFVCIFLIAWWRAIRDGVPVMCFRNRYPALCMMGLIAAQKATGMALVGALWSFLFLFTPGTMLFRCQLLIRPTLILIAIVLSLVAVDKTVSGISLFEHPANNRADYQARPDLSVFTSFDPAAAWATPLRDNQARSMANILFTDLFGDYWRYGILQNNGQSPEWNVFRSRVGIIASAIFAALFTVSLAFIVLSFFGTTARRQVLNERMVFSMLFFLGITILIAAGAAYYKPSKFDTIKWEYIIMFVPFMMIPPIHLLSKCRGALRRLVVIPVLSVIVFFAILQSIWISPNALNFG